MGEITTRETNESPTDDPEWRANFAALKKSLRSKRSSNYRVRIITEHDKYDDDDL
jgi:hypothetical protein